MVETTGGQGPRAVLLLGAAFLAACAAEPAASNERERADGGLRLEARADEERPGGDGAATTAGRGSGEAAGETAAPAERALSSDEQAVQRTLAETGERAVLYRLARSAFDASEQPVWDYGEEGTERPNPEIPHRTIDAAARERLARLVGPRTVARRETERTPGYTYILELLDDEGRTVAHLDVHAEGEASACLFLQDPTGEQLETGFVKLVLSPEGREAWLAALDRAWQGAAR